MTTMDISRVKMTPTQKKMYELLSDGLWHTMKELHSCLWDEQSQAEKTVAPHLSLLRSKVFTLNQQIVRESRNENGVRVAYYRLHTFSQ